jgi:hypothetical protein
MRGSNHGFYWEATGYWLIAAGELLHVFEALQLLRSIQGGVLLAVLVTAKIVGDTAVTVVSTPAQRGGRRFSPIWPYCGLKTPSDLHY